jgi:SAM-dependent methyltransferase
MAEPDRLAAIIQAYLAEGLPANIALMRLMIEARDPGEIAAALGRAPADASAGQRLDTLRALLERNAGAWATIRAVMAEAEHDRPAGEADAVAHWAGIFDRLARLAPEAGVALYALGSPELLAAATDEVVALMRRWGLLAPDRAVLDLGCGIGRLSLALAPHVAHVTGLDVSGEMIAEARRRGAGVANTTFCATDGRGLSGIGDDSVDVVLAADVFPYLVVAANDLPRAHVEEAARVLRPGGALLILNYSYRGDDAADRRDLEALSAAAGLRCERAGSRDLTLWDATTFLARKP